MKALTRLVLACLLTGVSVPAAAWDAVGHRLTAAIALSYLSQERQQQLVALLQQHPRFQADFAAAMPAFVQRGDAASQATWLLGQAAYWPDLARGLPEPERRRYNHPEWHYIDGAWVRDGASTQGNVYVGRSPLPDIAGAPATAIQTPSLADNVMTALDYNTRVLADPGQAAPERAVALCWVLHLMGDIHQPLHAGSLYSARLFAEGDRGGNGIPTDTGTLHARWDGALADDGIDDSLDTILTQLNGFNRPQIAGVDSDWSQWLNESRGLLLSLVYPDTTRQAIAIADTSGTELDRLRLDDGYVQTMQRIARQRLGLAGIRIAIWLENSLP